MVGRRPARRPGRGRAGPGRRAMRDLGADAGGAADRRADPAGAAGAAHGHGAGGAAGQAGAAGGGIGRRRRDRGGPGHRAADPHRRPVPVPRARRRCSPDTRPIPLACPGRGRRPSVRRSRVTGLSRRRRRDAVRPGRLRRPGPGDGVDAAAPAGRRGGGAVRRCSGWPPSPTSATASARSSRSTRYTFINPDLTVALARVPGRRVGRPGRRHPVERPTAWARPRACCSTSGGPSAGPCSRSTSTLDERIGDCSPGLGCHRSHHRARRPADTGRAQGRRGPGRRTADRRVRHRRQRGPAGRHQRPVGRPPGREARLRRLRRPAGRRPSGAGPPARARPGTGSASGRRRI